MTGDSIDGRRESVLFAYQESVVEPTMSALAEWVVRYPEFATDLIEFTRDWSLYNDADPDAVDAKLGGTWQSIPQHPAAFVRPVKTMAPPLHHKERRRERSVARRSVQFTTRDLVLKWKDIYASPRMNAFVDEAIQTTGRAALVVIYLDDYLQKEMVHGSRQIQAALLRQVVNSVRRVLRQRPQDEAFRVNRDEFVVVMPGADRTAAEATADALREMLRRSVAVNEETSPIQAKALVFSTRFGIATSPADGTDGQSLLHYAERALADDDPTA